MKETRASVERGDKGRESKVVKSSGEKEIRACTCREGDKGRES